MHEPKKGKHHKDIQDYFPESITNILEMEYKNNGSNSSIEQYKALRKTSYAKYNFKNDDAIDLAISWMEKGQTNNAIKQQVSVMGDFTEWIKNPIALKKRKWLLD